MTHEQINDGIVTRLTLAICYQREVVVECRGLYSFSDDLDTVGKI
jgi:hypothetical protein